MEAQKSYMQSFCDTYPLLAKNSTVQNLLKKFDKAEKSFETNRTESTARKSYDSRKALLEATRDIQSNCKHVWRGEDKKGDDICTQCGFADDMPTSVLGSYTSKDEFGNIESHSCGEKSGLVSNDIDNRD